MSAGMPAEPLINPTPAESTNGSDGRRLHGIARRVGLPTLRTSDRQLDELTDESIAAVIQGNRPPTIFNVGGVIARVVVDDEGGSRVSVLSKPGVRLLLAGCATWTASRGGQPADCSPPSDVVESVMVYPDLPLPRLDRVVSVPVFAADGTLADRPGYNEKARVWLDLGGLIVPKVPDRPTAADAERAARFVINELLAEFPFVGQPELAHAVAMAMAVPARALSSGPAPMFVVEAPMPGSGKGLLVSACVAISTGRPPTVVTECQSEDEWRKKITSLLCVGAPVVVLDNVRAPVDSGHLAAMLTSGRWSDRVLGASTMIDMPVRSQWITTGNNPVLSTEIARRSVRIRLDPSVERPWLREGWRHPDLLAWALSHRAELVAAVLTMIQAWVFEGSPLGDRVIGGFEGWSRTFGGILAVAGVDGFLGNLDDFYETADNETSALTSLIATWWDVHQDNAVGVSKLFPIALRVGVDLGEGKALSQKTRLGKLIAAQRDRVIAALKVELVGKPHGSALWRLRPASTHVHPGASGQHPPSRVAGGPQRQRPPAGEQVIPDPVEVGGRAPSAPVYVRAEMGRSNDVPPRPHVHLVDSAPEPEPIDVPEDILDQAPPPDPDWFAGLVANIDAQVEAGDGPG